MFWSIFLTKNRLKDHLYFIDGPLIFIQIKKGDIDYGAKRTGK